MGPVRETKVGQHNGHRGNESMCQEWLMELEELDAEAAARGRAQARPEKFQWRRVNRRPKLNARRSPALQAARQGMHQRRNVRLAW
jgi:hypothetical protein